MKKVTCLLSLVSIFLLSFNVKAEEIKKDDKSNEIKTNTEVEKINNLEDKLKEIEDKTNASPTPQPSIIPSESPIPSPIESPAESPKPVESIVPSASPIPSASPSIKPTPVPKKEDKIKKDEIKIKDSKKYFLHPGKLISVDYKVQANDDLKKLAKKYNTTSKKLMTLNNLKTPYLIIGQKIILDKYVQPTSNFEGLIINLPETKLYYFQKGKLILSYGVAIGTTSSRWQTPTGDYKIEEKVKDPSWIVPLSIQNEMKANGQAVITEIPAGPGNPLGRWFMSLGGGLGIHSTTAPWSIGSAASHGCMRMKSSEAEILFKSIKKDLPVKIIYQPIKINIDPENNIRMEVYNNIYSKNINFEELAKLILKDYELDKKINWDTVKKLIKMKGGASSIIGKRI